MNLPKVLFVVFFLSTFSVTAFCNEQLPEQDYGLPKEHVRKIKWIARFISGELAGRNIKTVTVEDFTDFYGRPSSKAKEISQELEIQLKNMPDKKFLIVSDSPEAIIKGIFLPFKDGKKFKLDISVVASGRDRIITSYTGIFKKPKTYKK